MAKIRNLSVFNNSVCLYFSSEGTYQNEKKKTGDAERAKKFKGLG
jgi:hypothetical protein